MRTSVDTRQNVLPVDNASVQERQVTVQCLNIGVKQVTQSLYKQLVEEDVIDHETGKLKGTVWGWVNLHSDCNGPRHCHAVWEINGQLKRSLTLDSFNLTKEGKDFHKDLHKVASQYLGLRGMAGLTCDNYQEWSCYLTLEVKGWSLRVEVPSVIRDLWRDLERACCVVPKTEAQEVDQLSDVTSIIDSYEYRIKEYVIGKNCLYTSESEAYDAMESMIDKAIGIGNNWSNSYKAIQDAGQLFIAVSGVWK